jgi:hypothetical protein
MAQSLKPTSGSAKGCGSEPIDKLATVMGSSGQFGVRNQASVGGARSGLLQPGNKISFYTRGESTADLNL